MPTNVSGQVWFVNVVSSSRARSLPAALSSGIVDLAVCRYEISTIYFVMAAHFAWSPAQKVEFNMQSGFQELRGMKI